VNFEFDSETRRRLGYRLIDRINEYFHSLPTRPVQLPLAQRTFGELPQPLPEFGEDDALAFLDEVCAELIDKGFHVPSANYFGLMNPTPTYVAVLAEALVAALNPQLASLARSQLASKIEVQTIRWIAERVVGDSKSNLHFAGTFTSGGNEANFSALALALAWKFPSIVEDGVASIGAEGVGYTSSEAHHSLDKSFGLLGLGRRALRRIPVTERIQLDCFKMEQAIEEDLAAGRKPFCVIATAGTTNSGAIDDLQRIADICRRYNLWLHLDGAYGAAAIFSDKFRSLVAGIESTDSITIDPHKWLAMPFAAGVVLTRHPEMLQQTFAVTTPYMPKVAEASLIDNFKISTQWSRRMNSLKLWLTLRIHGRHAYEQLIERQLVLMRYFAARIEQSRHFELMIEPVLPIANVRLKKSVVADCPEKKLTALQSAVVQQVTADGKQWVSLTHVNGRSVIRVMIISYLTEEHHLNELLQRLDSAAQKIQKQSKLSVAR
jgi:glutamate/tyrosine decarboxylase-like PLP-dependent enzyme